MNFSTITNSNRGFSIVEITVAMGLLGALSLGVMKLMDNSQKAAKSIENKDEISQLQHEISDVLQNPINCEATLGSKVAGPGGVDGFSSVNFVYQVINGVPTPKFSAINESSNKVSIQSMRVKTVDFNGSDGSKALAVLEVTFKKPTSSIGGQTIKKEIKVNANACWKRVIQNTNLQTLMSECSGAGKRLIEGPNSWNNSNWAICQDCTDAAQFNAIRACQSQGSGSGVDIDNVSKLSCLNIGGVFDDDTQKCLFEGKPLEDFVVDKVASKLPACVISFNPCSASSIYKYSGRIFAMNEFENYTVYNRACYPRYSKRGSVECGVAYPNYGSCGYGWGPHDHNGNKCETGWTENNNGTCTVTASSGHTRDRLRGGTEDCFPPAPSVCVTLSTKSEQRIKPNSSTTVYQCCQTDRF